MMERQGNCVVRYIEIFLSHYTEREAVRKGLKSKIPEYTYVPRCMHTV